MNEIEHPPFTEYMATGYSIGRLGWVIPSILFQANIAAAGRVNNDHNLSQYSFEGNLVVRLHLMRSSMGKSRSAVYVSIASKLSVGNGAHSGAEHHGGLTKLKR